MPELTITERTFYAPMIKIINEKGGTGVQEIIYQSVPDIQFELGGYKWLLSMKIGDTARIVRDGFLQYLRHKEESGIKFGILLLFPESVRKTEVSQIAVESVLREQKITALIDADIVKEEKKEFSFSQLISYLLSDVIPRFEKNQESYYPFIRVISLLRQQVEDLMREIKTSEEMIIKLVTDKNLLMGLGNLTEKNADAAGKFLASYIFLTQILFLRLLTAARKDLTADISEVSHNSLRQAFKKVLEINYRPIYEVDVLDAISKNYLKIHSN